MIFSRILLGVLILLETLYVSIAAMTIQGYGWEGSAIAAILLIVAFMHLLAARLVVRSQTLRWVEAELDRMTETEPEPETEGASDAIEAPATGPNESGGMFG